MGVDVSSIMAFGTDDERIGSKLLEILRSEDDEGNTIIDCVNEYCGDDGFTPSQINVIDDFRGFELWNNSYDGSFEGFGIQADPNTIGSDQIEKTTQLFKKYDLGEPGWVSFSHWW